MPKKSGWGPRIRGRDKVRMVYSVVISGSDLQPLGQGSQDEVEREEWKILFAYDSLPRQSRRINLDYQDEGENRKGLGENTRN